MPEARLTGILDGADTTTVSPEDDTMYPTEHPSTALVLARYRMQEDIARAEAYRAAKNAGALPGARDGAKKSHTTTHSRGMRRFAPLRAALGRT